MAVKIRLARRGRKKLPKFDVVIADARSPRDGKFIEKIGSYDPLTIPATIHVNEDRAFDWLMKGAQPSDTVKAILSYRGIMLKKHLQIGVVKGAITQEQADERLAQWKQVKESKITSKLNKASEEKQKLSKIRKEAEIKIKVTRAENIKKKVEIALSKLVETVRGENTDIEAEATTIEANSNQSVETVAEITAVKPLDESTLTETPASESSSLQEKV